MNDPAIRVDPVWAEQFPLEGEPLRFLAYRKDSNKPDRETVGVEGVTVIKAWADSRGNNIYYTKAEAIQAVKQSMARMDQTRARIKEHGRVESLGGGNYRVIFSLPELTTDKVRNLNFDGITVISNEDGKRFDSLDLWILGDDILTVSECCGMYNNIYTDVASELVGEYLARYSGFDVDQYILERQAEAKQLQKEVKKRALKMAKK